MRHHLLTNYCHTILSVVLAQFSGLGFLDGMEGIIRLAEASPYIKVGPVSSDVELMCLCSHKAPCQSPEANGNHSMVSIQLLVSSVVVLCTVDC